MPQSWIHCPPELADGTPASNFTVEIHPDTVSLKFIRETTLNEYPAPDDSLDRHTTGIVVAHVIYSRKQFENLPDVLRNIVDRTRHFDGHPDEGPDNPGT